MALDRHEPAEINETIERLGLDRDDCGSDSAPASPNGP